MLIVVHQVVEAVHPRQEARAGRPVVAAMVLLHGIELVVLLGAAGVTARLARAHPGHGAGLPTLLVLAAAVIVGWQACRLLRGRRSLNVAGLAVQAAILMTAIAVATQSLAAGMTGIVLSCATLAGWGLSFRPVASRPRPPRAWCRPLKLMQHGQCRRWESAGWRWRC